VVLTLELASLARGAIPDECDDARTIGVLASDMMLGRITRAGEPASAVSIPPNMLTAVTRSIIAVRRCHAGNVKQVVGSLLTALQSAADEAAAAEPVGAAVAPPTVTPPAVELAAVDPVDAEPMAIASIVEPARSSMEIERDYVDPIMVVEPRFGFNARLASAVAAVAIIGVLAVPFTEAPFRDTWCGRVGGTKRYTRSGRGRRFTSDDARGQGGPRRPNRPMRRHPPNRHQAWTAVRAGRHPPRTSASVSSPRSNGTIKT
jgi:hypothetical protein